MASKLITALVISFAAICNADIVQITVRFDQDCEFKQPRVTLVKLHDHTQWFEIADQKNIKAEPAKRTYVFHADKWVVSDKFGADPFFPKVEFGAAGYYFEEENGPELKIGDDFRISADVNVHSLDGIVALANRAMERGEIPKASELLDSTHVDYSTHPQIFVLRTDLLLKRLRKEANAATLENEVFDKIEATLDQIQPSANEANTFEDRALVLADAFANTHLPGFQSEADKMSHAENLATAAIKLQPTNFRGYRLKAQALKVRKDFLSASDTIKSYFTKDSPFEFTGEAQVTSSLITEWLSILEAWSEAPNRDDESFAASLDQLDQLHKQAEDKLWTTGSLAAKRAKERRERINKLIANL